MYETVDRARWSPRSPSGRPGARVLIQVDTTGEPGKGGCPLSDVEVLVAAARAAGLDVAGSDDGRPHGGRTRGGAGGLPRGAPPVDRLGLAVCSMGMSDDLEVAVQEGSTQIRVGTACSAPAPVASP